MSYDLYLKEGSREGPVIEFDFKHHMTGGTYALGGTNEARLNITYNYWPFFKQFGAEGIRTLYGMTGAESIPILQKAIDSLSGIKDDDYWKPTEGNAKDALRKLLALAQMRPDGVWDGD